MMVAQQILKLRGSRSLSQGILKAYEWCTHIFNFKLAQQDNNVVRLYVSRIIEYWSRLSSNTYNNVV
jgi:hypothetical protein